ncbi:uncharacterized protein [Palaemon carinicauda]|uniref:uncharacterized protein isoform X1 n=1 Tax=Palaemon carinicauda TaxID=392227 RepID=UPI0035B573F1
MPFSAAGMNPAGCEPDKSKDCKPQGASFRKRKGDRGQMLSFAASSAWLKNNKPLPLKIDTDSVMLPRSKSYKLLSKRKEASSPDIPKKKPFKMSLSFLSAMNQSKKCLSYECATDSPSTFEAELCDQENMSPNDPDFIKRASFRWKQKNNYGDLDAAALDSPPIVKGMLYSQWPTSALEADFKTSVSSQNLSKITGRSKSSQSFSRMSARVKSSPNLAAMSAKTPSSPKFNTLFTKVSSSPSFNEMFAKVPSSPTFSQISTMAKGSENSLLIHNGVKSNPNFSKMSAKVISSNFAGMFHKVRSSPNFSGTSAKAESSNLAGMTVNEPNLNRMPAKVKSSLNLSRQFQKVKSSPNIPGMIAEEVRSPNYYRMSTKVKSRPTQSFFSSSNDYEVCRRSGSGKSKRPKNVATNKIERKFPKTRAMDDSVVDAVLKEAKKAKFTQAKITSFLNKFNIGQQQSQNTSLTKPLLENGSVSQTSSLPKGLKHCSKSYHCGLSSCDSSDVVVTQPTTFEDIFVTEPAIAENFAIMFPTEPRPEWHRHLRQVLQKAGQKIFKKPEHHDTNIPENLRYQLKQIYVY